MPSNSASGGSPGSERPGIFIKPHGVGQPTELHQMESTHIMELLHSLDDRGTVAAGQDFADLGEALNRIAAQIARHGNSLAEHWRGGAATVALRKFKDMHDYAAALAAQATQTGEVLKWMGNDVLPQYKRLPDPPGASPAAQGSAQGSANHTARMYLKSLSEHVITANNALPSRIVGTEPPSLNGTRRTTAPTLGSPGGGPGPVSPGGPPPAGPGGSLTPYYPPSVPSGPTAPVGSPPAGHLSGIAPASAPPAAPVAPAANWPGAATGGPNGMSAVPLFPGPGAGSGGAFGDGLPGGAESIAAGAGDAPAASTAGTGSAAAEAAGAETGAVPMMGGGAGGQQDTERQRQAWMNDDNDIWAVPADGPPPVIG